MLRVLSAVGLVFGLVSVIAGTRVFAGIDTPDYVVRTWLVLYNIVAGVVAATAAAALWVRWPWAGMVSRLLAASHASVLALLVGMRASGLDVANDSIGAMAFRTTLWLLIVAAASRS